MRTIIAAGLLIMLAAPMATAQQTDRNPNMNPQQGLGLRGWGAEVGYSVEPDQFVFGAHADLGEVAERVWILPNVEVGVGDDVTLIAINLAAAYRFSEGWEAWRPYLGVEPEFQFISVDIADDLPDEVAEDDTETEFGLMALGGVEKGMDNGNRLFAEIKLGLFDTPDAKFMVGYTFF